MHKKHLLLPLTLLTPIQNKPFPSHRWMSDMMQEMEESFSRMHEMMEEAYNYYPQDGSSKKNVEPIRLEIQKEPDHILLTLRNIHEGTIDAQFDENVLRLKHPEISAHIRQIRDRYNRTGISVLLESEYKVCQDEGNKKLKQSSYSSSSQTIAIEKPVILDEPEITYDEEKKELTVKFIYKADKKIAVNIKKPA